jgi:hypothetical protein
MAKRVRGSTSRPGQRPPRQRTATRPATKPATKPAVGTAEVVARPPDELTDAEEARAAELEAAIVAEEREAEATKRRARAARTSDPVAVARPSGNIAISAAEEYAYVARDVRRIAIVGGSIVAFLVGLWAVAHVAGLGGF